MAPRIEGLAPLLQVFDMPTSIRFYRDVLGFEVKQRSSERSPDDCDWVLLESGHSQLMLNTAYEFDKRPPSPQPARVAAHRDTGLFFGCRDLDALYTHLLERGVGVNPPKVAPYGMKQLWAMDPDGYELCFQWPA
jgi:glyoxylase I family protein